MIDSQTINPILSHDKLIASNIGVLLINLGSPESPTPKGVAQFLGQFLSDKRVINLPKIWRALLYLWVLPTRSPRVARLYQKIWTRKGSPLIHTTQNLAIHLEGYLSRSATSSIRVCAAMTYGSPSISEALQQLHNMKVKRVVILPLFPQYSGVTTGAAFDAVSLAYQRLNIPIPTLHFISSYWDFPTYIYTLGQHIKSYWRKYGRQSRIIFSFHGLPQKLIMRGDPYAEHCNGTALALAKELNLSENEWKISYQSRFGRAQWLSPDLEDQLMAMRNEGVTSVLVISPSFAVDCLETLEELDIRARELFINAGGEEFHLLPALNDSLGHVEILSDLIKKFI